MSDKPFIFQPQAVYYDPSESKYEPPIIDDDSQASSSPPLVFYQEEPGSPILPSQHNSDTHLESSDDEPPISIRFEPSTPKRDPERLELPQRTPTTLHSWRDVGDLDKFLTRLYQYFVGKGAYSIFLTKCVNVVYFGLIF
jgi:hypothetical protein